MFGATLWGLIAFRFAWLQSKLAALHKNQEMREWLATFSHHLCSCVLLVRPPAGTAVLALPPNGALDLLTYARYAKELLIFGTADVDFATFEYLRSPASAFLLAWHSLFYLGDPLDAAVPALIMVAALAGTVTVRLVGSLFGLSWRAAMAVAAITVCAPMFRWALTTYSLGELLSATSVLYLIGVVCSAVAARSLSASILLGIGAGGTLLFFSARSAVGSPGTVVRGLVEAVHRFSLLAFVGLPDGLPQGGSGRRASFGCACGHTVRSLCMGRGNVGLSPVASTRVDQRICRSQAGERSRHLYGSRRHHRERRTAGRLSLQAATLAGRMAPVESDWQIAVPDFYAEGRRRTWWVIDRPRDVLHTGSKAHVIGRGVANDRLPFENVSRQQPMFIQNFGCEGVGHGDTVPPLASDAC